MNEPSIKALAAAEEIVAAVEQWVQKITRMGFSDPEERPNVVKAVATLIDRHFREEGGEHGEADDPDVSGR